jgi:hypothetical protein
MGTDPTPVTLPEIPSLAVTPTASGQKRSRTLPAGGEGDLEDTGASGSGTHQTVITGGSVDPTLPPPRGLGELDDAEITPKMVRANAVTAFIGPPLLPEPDQLRVDNIGTLPSLSVEGPAQTAAFRLFALAYSQHEAEAI